MPQLSHLVDYIDRYLRVQEFKDYCPNGLQVEGRQQVTKLATGVTASLACIEAACEWGADALLVHHGYFWQGEASPITGIKKNRLQRLLAEDISLLAYHLPLDAHPVVGNNAQLGVKLDIQGLQPLQKTGKCALANIGSLAESVSIETLVARCEQTFKRQPTVIAAGPQQIQRIAWCTGAAQGMIEAAVSAQADVYLSGEISEQTVHIARESGIHYISAGHHATERYGVQALGEHLYTEFALEHCFFDIDNPV